MTCSTDPTCSSSGTRYLCLACQVHLFPGPDLQGSMSHSCLASTTSALWHLTPCTCATFSLTTVWYGCGKQAQNSSKRLPPFLHTHVLYSVIWVAFCTKWVDNLRHASAFCMIKPTLNRRKWHLISISPRHNSRHCLCKRSLSCQQHGSNVMCAIYACLASH